MAVSTVVKSKMITSFTYKEFIRNIICSLFNDEIYICFLDVSFIHNINLIHYVGGSFCV